MYGWTYKKDGNKAEMTTHKKTNPRQKYGGKEEDTKTTLHLLLIHKDYPAFVARMNNRCRVVFVSFSSLPCFCSGLVFLCVVISALFPSFL